MNRLQPTRTVSATRLITVTATYETELTQAEFLSLTPIASVSKRLLGDIVVENFDILATELLCDYGDLFTEITATADLTDAMQGILEIVNAFNFERFGTLLLSAYDDQGYTVIDGNQRSVALALLLKAEQIQYQPVTAMYTEINQSEVEQLTIDEAVRTQTITKAQQGMRHYPVSRKR